MTTQGESILVIDGHALAFRAFYSVPAHLTDPDGNPINVVYGFVSLLFKGIDVFDPTYVVVCFDRPEPTFRDDLFDQYKATRSPAPEEFKVQMPVLRSTLEKLGFVVFEKPGYEADDILGTVSRLAEQSGIQCRLMTSDMDTLQLVTDHTTVIANKKGISEFIEYTPQKVQEKYQIPVDRIVDMKALKGDSSDNIPGVPGIGEKTAVKLLNQWGSLDELYAHIDDVEPKGVRQKLVDHQKLAYLSQELAQICTEVPIEVVFEKLKYQPQWAQILTLFKAYQFSSLIRRYEDRSDEVLVDNSKNQSQLGHYELVDSPAALKKRLKDLDSGFSIDLETTSLVGVEAQIVGIAISIEPGSAFYVPTNSDLVADQLQFGTLNRDPDPYPLGPCLKLLKPLLENPDIPKITHNGKYEYLVLQNYGITLKGIAFDTMLAGYLLYPGERLGLKDLGYRFCDVNMTHYEEVAGKGKSQIPFQDVPIEQAVQYAGADADVTYRLKELFEPQLKKANRVQLLVDIELPLQIVLAKMERAGVHLEQRYLEKLEKEFSAELLQTEQTIYEETGQEFNIKSPKQLGEILFEKMGLPVIKKTKTGPSTDGSVLEKLKAHHPVAESLLKFRMIEKLQNTYVQALPKMVVSRTGYVHTSFNQTIAITGRLSSTHPNLQNIPIRTEEGIQIRQAFVASPGHQLLSADYSQIELRVLAHICQDPRLVTAFQEGQDIHTNTAAIINGIGLDEVSKEQRYRAKAVNFGIIYGISAFGLSEQLHIPRGEAKAIIDDYFEKFPEIKAFMESTIAYAREKGYVLTEFGRYRPIPDIRSNQFGKRSFAERAAVNTRVQGTAADIMKIAMIQVQNEIEAKGLAAKMILQVHDELVFDVPQSELDQVQRLVVDRMTQAVSFRVPLSVDVAVGPNWKSVS